MKLLVGLDDSPYSQAAARVAIDLAARLPASRLTALHVVSVVTASGSLLKDLPGRLGFEPAVVAPDVEATYRAHGEQVLAAFSELARSAGVPAEVVLEHGAVVDSLVRYGEQSDLLVLGDHGETEVRFPGQGGGHVGAMLDQCTVGLLLVPTGARPLRSVVLGYDGSIGARHALRAVRALFPAAVDTVHLVFVGETGAEVLDEAAADLHGGTVTRHVVHGVGVREALLAVATETGAEVVALGFHGKRSLRAFLYGSSYEALLDSPEVSLLVVH